MESHSGKKFIVDEGGNKRKAISNDDVRTAIHDIIEWFKSNASSYYDKYLKENKGNSEDKVN